MADEEYESDLIGGTSQTYRHRNTFYHANIQEAEYATTIQHNSPLYQGHR
jgi:hypothetical protein